MPAAAVQPDPTNVTQVEEWDDREVVVASVASVASVALVALVALVAALVVAASLVARLLRGGVAVRPVAEGRSDRKDAEAFALGSWFP